MSLNAQAEELTTTDKVAAGIWAAGAATVAILANNSTSGNSEGEEIPTLPENPDMPADIDNLPSHDIDNRPVIDPELPNVPDTDPVVSISANMILVNGEVIGVYSGQGQIDFVQGGTALVVDTSEGYTIVMDNGDRIYLTEAGDGTYRVAGIDSDRDMDGNAPKFIGDAHLEDGVAMVRLDDGTMIAITEDGYFKIIGVDGEVKDGNINDAGLTVEKRGEGSFLVTNAQGDTYSIVVVDGRVSVVADIKGAPELQGVKTRLESIDKSKLENAKAKVKAKLVR